jgi:hypothetical protein
MAKQPFNPLIYAPTLPIIIAATGYSTYRSSSSSHLLANLVASIVLWGGISVYLRKQNASWPGQKKDRFSDDGGRGGDARRRRMMMVGAVIGGVVGVITDRALGVLGAICWKVCRPVKLILRQLQEGMANSVFSLIE